MTREWKCVCGKWIPVSIRACESCGDYYNDGELIQIRERGIAYEVTRVVNLRKEPYDVYIGRGKRGEVAYSPEQRGYFGNPYSLAADDERGATIERYRAYFNDRIETDPEFKAAVEGLRGKTLGCFCKPHACHGDVIVEYLESEKND